MRNPHFLQDDQNNISEIWCKLEDEVKIDLQETTVWLLTFNYFRIASSVGLTFGKQCKLRTSFCRLFINPVTSCLVRLTVQSVGTLKHTTPMGNAQLPSLTKHHYILQHYIAIKMKGRKKARYVGFCWKPYWRFSPLYPFTWPLHPHNQGVSVLPYLGLPIPT
jgi:hypothetical protein